MKTELEEYLLTVIVPTYNRSILLDKTLTSLANQDISTDNYEVLVIDDGSTDSTRSIVERYKNDINITYYYQEDRGFRAGSARNIGVAVARSKYCVFIDSGIICSPEFLKNHYYALTNSESCVVLGEILCFSDGCKLTPQNFQVSDRDSLLEIFSIQSKEFPDVRKKFYDRIHYDLEKVPFPWVVLWGGNFSTNRELLLEVGLFDNHMHCWGGEDLDLGYRLFKAGAKFLALENIPVVHIPHEEDRLAKNLGVKKNYHYLSRKHNDKIFEYIFDYGFDELNNKYFYDRIYLN